MIYLVSEQQELFKSDLYSRLSPEKALEMLKEEKILGADTETEGMSPFTKRLLTVQLGTEEFQIVWDCTTVSVQLLKPILEDPDILTIWWNYAFDGKFLYHQGIIPVNVYDGMLAEQLLWLGYPKGMHSMSLASAGKHYCDVELDKSVRGQIITRGLTPAVVQYAGYDVKWEIPIYRAQLEELKRADLLKAIQIENEFVKVMAYIEYCGVRLDVPRWKQKMKKDQEKMEIWTSVLNEWVVNYSLEHPEFSKFTKVDLQGDLFSGFDTSPKCTLNWKSQKQLIPFFEGLGFNLEVFDKKTKEKKKSVAGDVIARQKEIQPELAEAYCNFKDAAKVVESFGQNFLDAIDKGDGRIHASFFQLGTDTARLSSGGGEAGVNMQQLPHDAETRACFAAEEGNKWISADYQSQESRIIASTANDAAMIDLFENGCGDVHSLVAKMSYPDIIGDTPVEEIKYKFKSYRQDAKGIEFAINYGGDANTIANNKGIPKKEAEEIYANFMKGFPGVKKYQDFARAEVMRRGYILMNPITRHKAFIYDWDELKETQENMKDPMFMAVYENYKRSDPNNPIVKAVNHYKKRKAASEKQSINYRIQNRGAMAFKLASIKLFNWIRKNNLLFKVKYCVPAHDELNLECPKEIAQEVADILVKCMVAGGQPFCDKVYLGADVSIEDHWVH